LKEDIGGDQTAPGMREKENSANTYGAFVKGGEKRGGRERKVHKGEKTWP